MFDQKRRYIIIIGFFTLLIGYLHYSTSPENYILHEIQTQLHYIPLLLAALVFGLRGAVLTFAALTVVYLPYFFIIWKYPFFSTNRLLLILLSGFFAFVVACLAGFLVDRERRHREQSEKNRYLAGIGRVATTIVHDLKNPLLTILGFTKRIRDGKGNMDNALQAITDSARNMQRIVNDVLDFAKPIRLTFKEEDVRGIINRACVFCKTTAERQKVTLSTDLPEEPLNALIGGAHMERAIINIISNAIDASGKGEKVTVAAAHGKNGLIIRIKDYGSGMDRETLDNIFVPFYTKKPVGTGLGMPIAKKIIEGHQGRIDIATQMGVGTEMIIELPYQLTEKKG